MPWLQKWNPKINWVHYTIDFLASSPTDDYNQTPNSLDPDNEITHLFSQQYPQGVERTLCEHPSSQELCEEHVNKVTISTEIAMAEKPKEVPIPEFCTDFTNVFSENTYNQLPPHRTFDHAIDLKDTFIPKIAKIYPLNPAEKKLAKPSLKNISKQVASSLPNLLKLPHSSSSQRRMEPYVPVKITDTSIVTPSKMPTPSLSSLNLLMI